MAMQDGAVVARLAHNQKVGGSTPSPATNFPGRVLGNSPVYALKATWEKAESEVRSSLGRGAGHPVSYRPLPLPFSTARNVLAEALPQQAASSFRAVGGAIVAERTGMFPPSRVESAITTKHNTPLTFNGWLSKPSMRRHGSRPCGRERDEECGHTTPAANLLCETGGKI